jgi:4-hydroxyproline epimerase
MAERLAAFRERHDQFRSAVVNEPRGSDVLVGALLCEPVDRAAAAGVIFFNNVGYLGMCGHGMIGVVRTLAHLGRIRPGKHRIETPVGAVSVELHEDESVSVINVPSYRKAAGVAIVGVPPLGGGAPADQPPEGGTPTVVGDVAWGGNWFYLVKSPPLTLGVNNVEQLVEFTWRIRQAINSAGFPEVDHIELFGPPQSPGANSQNFVLCPGKAYDRSPCGTGTSAKLACLAADGELEPGKPWVQEGILGTQFVGSYEWEVARSGDRPQPGGRVIPTITGTAFITADSRLLLDDADPFCWGIRGMTNDECLFNDEARMTKASGPLGHSSFVLP